MSSRMSTCSRRRAKSCPPPQRPPTYRSLATIPDRCFLVDPDASLLGLLERKQNIGWFLFCPLSFDSLGTPAESSREDVADTFITPLPINAKETSCETHDDA